MMLKKKRKTRDNEEGNIVVFTDLGVYSEDPVEDKKINEALIKFLAAKGYPRPKIKRNKSDKSG